MINNPVIIIRVIIVFHTSQKVVHPGTVEKRYKVSNTGIKELHPSKLPDIRSNHKGIHSFHSVIKLHQGCHFPRELFYRIMDQVNASLCFVSKTPSAETAKCTVTDRLLFKTGGMESILETDIKKKGIHEFLIRQSHKLFKHHTANDHIYRSIGAIRENILSSKVNC